MHHDDGWKNEIRHTRSSCVSVCRRLVRMLRIGHFVDYVKPETYHCACIDPNCIEKLHTKIIAAKIRGSCSGKRTKTPHNKRNTYKVEMLFADLSKAKLHANDITAMHNRGVSFSHSLYLTLHTLNASRVELDVTEISCSQRPESLRTTTL